MAIGFTPSALRTRRQKVDAVTKVNKDFNETNGRELDRIAIMVMNQDPLKARAAMPEVVKLAARTGQQPKAIMDTIYDRAVDMDISTDPTREGNIGTSDQRNQINGMFGKPAPSEEARVGRKQQLQDILGRPFEPPVHPVEFQKQRQKSLLQARNIDALMQQHSMTLQEARQYLKANSP
jgi:hypothetical protein